MRWIGVLVGLLVGGGAVPATAQQASAIPPLATEAAPLVFEGVTVVDVENGTLHPGQRVVIVGTHIQAIGDTGDGAGALRLPKGAQVVDAREEYLIPGLWDMHLHPFGDLSGFFYPTLVANGITGMRDAKSSMELLDTAVAKWRRIMAGTLVGPPRQLLAGPPVGWSSFDPPPAELKAHGANFLKVYPISYEEARAIRAVGLPFGGHVEPHGDSLMGMNVTAIQASDSGQRIIDHLTSSGGMDEICFGVRASVAQCQPTVERLRKNGTWFAPTLTAHFAYRELLPSINPRSVNVYSCVGAGANTFMAGKALRGNWLRDSLQKKDTAAVDSGAMTLAARLGMPILAGTDASWLQNGLFVIPVMPGFSLHGELALLVAEGLTPLQALQAATLNPAKVINGTDSLGTVAAGKLADLVLLDANPLADITNTTTIRAVVANGRYFDRQALDNLLAEARARLLYWGVPSSWNNDAGGRDGPCGGYT